MTPEGKKQVLEQCEMVESMARRAASLAGVSGQPAEKSLLLAALHVVAYRGEAFGPEDVAEEYANLAVQESLRRRQRDAVARMKAERGL